MLFDWIWVSEPDGLREEDSVFARWQQIEKTVTHIYYVNNTFILDAINCLTALF